METASLETRFSTVTFAVTVETVNAAGRPFATARHAG